MISNMCVMRNMHTFMQEITITDNSPAFRRRGTVDHYVFADHIVVADNNQRTIAFIFKILRFCCNDSPVEYTVSLTQTGATHDTGVRHDFAIVANLYILVNVCKRMNCYIRSQFCTGIYIS